MPGFTYQAVKGKEFPLWFVITILLGLVVAIVIAFKEYNKDDFKTHKKTEQKNEEEMPNYMGKDRLKRILLHYIYGRYGIKAYNDTVSKLKECKEKKFYVKKSRRKTGAFYTYTSGFPGCNEWLKCFCLGHDFLVEAWGINSKRVVIQDLFKGEDEPLCDHFFTFYDENFVPKPNETELSGLGFAKVKPFSDDNTTYNGIERDNCVCFNIAKTA